VNIEDLTIKQARELAALFGTTAAKAGTDHPFVGRYVICRCYGAGVHAGELVSKSGSDVILKDSRRLWSWKAEGVALSGVAQNGMLPGQKIDVMNPLIDLSDVIECIPAAHGVKETIDGSAKAR
jgi:hypothetical protein